MIRTAGFRALCLCVSLSLSLCVRESLKISPLLSNASSSSPNARTTANNPVRAVAPSTTEEAFSRPRVLFLPVRIYSRQKQWFWCSVRFARKMVVVFGNITNNERRSGSRRELCRDEIQNETLIQSNPNRKRPELFHRRTHRPREINSGGQIDGTVRGNRE